MKNIVNTMKKKYLRKKLLQKIRLSDDSNIVSPYIIIGGEYISIGKNFHAASNFRIEAISSFAGKTFSPNITIGDNVTIGNFCHIGAVNMIDIESGVLIGSNVLIIDHTHGDAWQKTNIIPTERPLISKGGVTICENVWICDNVVILPDVTIGKGAIIGANSVVTKDVPENSVIAGSPAKVIRYLE